MFHINALLPEKIALILTLKMNQAISANDVLWLDDGDNGGIFGD